MRERHSRDRFQQIGPIDKANLRRKYRSITPYTATITTATIDLRKYRTFDFADVFQPHIWSISDANNNGAQGPYNENIFARRWGPRGPETILYSLIRYPCVVQQWYLRAQSTCEKGRNHRKSRDLRTPDSKRGYANKLHNDEEKIEI